MTELTRRTFLSLAGAVTAGYFIGMPKQAFAATPFTLPPLPYGDSDLAPVISQETIGFHYGKHHQGYITNLNTLLASPDYSEFAGLSLEEILRACARKRSLVSLFNNAAQAWNHEFYWNSLTPHGGDAQKPTGALLEKLASAFGSYDAFKAQFREAAVGQFGSGWAWLVAERGELTIVSTGNADNPLVARSATSRWGEKGEHHHHNHRRSQVPLLTIDVWEHAYYIDYRNRRKDHVTAVIDQLLDWKKAAQRLDSAS